MKIEEVLKDIQLSLRLWGRKPQKGSVEECIKVLQMQVPKKPIGGVDVNGVEYMICRECSAIVADGDWVAHYCPDCGQRVDWGEK